MLESVAYRDESLPGTDEFLRDVIAGLTANPKSLPCKYFYNERGSELFGNICETPEYYVTRAEIALLKKILPEIAQKLGTGCDILEFGSGMGEKIRLLLDALVKPASYTPMDISEEVLMKSSQELKQLYPEIAIRPWVGDYTVELAKKLDNLSGFARQVVFFPGSTISNFTPEEALSFLRRVRRWLGNKGVLLIGVDTVKSESVLNAAYNDEEGHTAAFNINLLHRIRDELEVEVDPDDFSHLAFFNKKESRIEMHLVSDKDQSLNVDGEIISFAKGESIHTENSYKYEILDFQRLARSAGFRAEQSWIDEKGLFGFHYLVSDPG